MLFDLGSPPPKPLVGIARLRAEAGTLSAKRTAEYFELPSRSILNRCSNPQMPFVWTINPYRGCEFGCRYCYARYTHEFMGLEDGRLFETMIYAKADAARLLRADLRKAGGEGIAIGTSTDPYQPAERRYRVTRSLLEIFADERGRDLSITTKGDLIARDLDLLLRIRERNRLSVNITVTTTDEKLARALEPRAPRPELRLRAAASLAAAGIAVGVFANPVMPGVTDSDESLAAVATAAKTAGASYFGGGLLFLMPSAQKQFQPFLEKAYPHLAEAYRKGFGADPYIRGPYKERVQARIQRVRERFGLASRPAPAALPTPNPQLELFGEQQAPTDARKPLP